MLASCISKRLPSPTSFTAAQFFTASKSGLLSADGTSLPTRVPRASCGANFNNQDSLLWKKAAKNLGLILLWYALSTGLSLYNKQLVGTTHGLFGNGAFPAPLLMSGVQFAVQYALVKGVLLTGIIERSHTKSRTWREWAITGVPNGMCSGIDIAFSTKSLVFITIGFYTMCKSTVPVFLLLFAFLWRIERPSVELGCVVSVITVGLVLLVRGEAHFHLVGFLLVMVASCLSGLRFTLTQLLLHGSPHDAAPSKGGPLEVLELLTPIMSVTVLSLSLGWEQLWFTLPASPYFATWQHTLLSLLIIIVGGIVAFAMVWTEFKVIQETSALTFMMAGTVKEVLTVMAGVLVMGDALTVVNCIGLVVIIAGVLMYNLYKYRKVKQGVEVHGGSVGGVAVTSSGRHGKDRSSKEDDDDSGTPFLPRDAVAGDDCMELAMTHMDELTDEGSAVGEGDVESAPLLPDHADFVVSK